MLELSLFILYLYSSRRSCFSSPAAFFNLLIPKAISADTKKTFGFSIPICFKNFLVPSKTSFSISSSSTLYSSILFTTNINLSLDCFPPTLILLAISCKKLFWELLFKVPPFITKRTNIFDEELKALWVISACLSSIALSGPGVSTKIRDTSFELTNGIFPFILTSLTLLLSFKDFIVV